MRPVLLSQARLAIKLAAQLVLRIRTSISVYAASHIYEFPEAGAIRISEVQKARVRVIGGRLAGTPAGLCPPMMPICVSGSVLTNGAGTLILISLHLAMNVFLH